MDRIAELRKVIAAAVAPLIILLNHLGVLPQPIDPGLIDLLAGVLAAVLVYVVPNRAAATSK